MSLQKFLAPVAFAAFVAIGGTAVAAPTVYTTQASFAAAISGAAVDSFDDLSSGSTVSSPLDRQAGSYGYTASASGVDKLFFPASDGGTDYWLAPYDSAAVITLSNFSAGVSGVGGFFFGSDVGGAFASTGSLTITATDASGTTTQTFGNPSTGTFFGFVSTAGLTSLTVSSNTADFFATVNDITLGTTTVAAVPEPETCALMLGGLGLVGWMARRRKA